MRDASVLENLSISSEYLQPELIRFGYVERRREDRYLAETRVEVIIGSKKYPGMSKDISTRGIRIQLDDAVDVKKGAAVKVGLVSLQKKKSSANLMDIPYRYENPGPVDIEVLSAEVEAVLPYPALYMVASPAALVINFHEPISTQSKAAMDQIVADHALDNLKASRRAEVDRRTDQLIEDGFEHESILFPLTQEYQTYWTALYSTRTVSSSS